MAKARRLRTMRATAPCAASFIEAPKATRGLGPARAMAQTRSATAARTAADPQTRGTCRPCACGGIAAAGAPALRMRMRRTGPEPMDAVRHPRGGS